MQNMVVVGKISTTPVKRSVRNGDVISFTITTTETWTTLAGDQGSRSEKHRIKLFGKLAQAHHGLKQGDLVAVTEQLRTDVIQKEDGSEGIFTDLIADKLSLFV